MLMARQLGLGGTERQLCEIAKALDPSRFEAHVGCFHAHGMRADELRAAGIPILDLPIRSYLRPHALLGAVRMGRYLRQKRIQIVHTFDVPLNQFGVPVARAFGVPVVLSSQRAHRQLISALNLHFLRLTDQMVDGIVVNSLALRRQLIEDERVPPALIHLCYNAIDTCRFQPGPRCRPAPLAGAALVVGVICAFRPEKDLPTLLEAFHLVRGVRPGLKLLLVGSGSCLELLRAQSRRLALGEDCHFEPATADVPPWLRAIDIFVLPSISEALSNSLIEAMACGCCAVASRVGGNPELVDHERTGLLFRPGDASGLAAALRRLIENDGLRETLASAGSAQIHRSFSLHASAQRMQEIYSALLERNTGLKVRR